MICKIVVLYRPLKTNEQANARVKTKGDVVAVCQHRVPNCISHIHRHLFAIHLHKHKFIQRRHVMYIFCASKTTDKIFSMNFIPKNFCTSNFILDAHKIQNNIASRNICGMGASHKFYCRYMYSTHTHTHKHLVGGVPMVCTHQPNLMVMIKNDKRKKKVLIEK